MPMSEQEQTTHFSDELDALVNRFRSEYEMSYAAVVGVLQMKMFLLCQEAKDLHEGNDGSAGLDTNDE